MSQSIGARQDPCNQQIHQQYQYASTAPLSQNVYHIKYKMHNIMSRELQRESNRFVLFYIHAIFLLSVILMWAI
jgi:hypothetical protein